MNALRHRCDNRFDQRQRASSYQHMEQQVFRRLGDVTQVRLTGLRDVRPLDASIQTESLATAAPGPKSPSVHSFRDCKHKGELTASFPSGERRFHISTDPRGYRDRVETSGNFASQAEPRGNGKGGWHKTMGKRETGDTRVTELCSNPPRSLCCVIVQSRVLR